MEVEVDVYLEPKNVVKVEEFEDHLDEVEQATDFLQNTGLSNLSKIHQEGKEITDAMLNSSIRAMNLSERQAQTVKQRIRTLNKTIHNRQPRRKLRQDVREVAWRNIETSSTGTRSRSATPDSLDSVSGLTEELLTSDEDQQMSLPNFTTDTDLLPKSKVTWTTSDPIPSAITFNKADKKPTIAQTSSDGIILKGFHQMDEFSTAHLSINQKDKVLSSSHNNLYVSDGEEYEVQASAKETISFESICRQNSNEGNPWTIVSTQSGEVYVDSITDAVYQHLKPLLWLEITLLFDQYNIPCYKRKPNKRVRKEKQGNVFGVTLSTLVMRDMRTDDTMVPQIFKTVLNQLQSRCIREDGILRLSGHKQKIETLCTQIESSFYSSPQQIEHTISGATCHELTSVLKKLLRELPESILTVELSDMFYKCHAITVPQDQVKALNLLVLLLPIEYRNTLRTVVNFLHEIITNAEFNRMTLHNVCAIISPSLFNTKLSITSGDEKNMSSTDAAAAITTVAICCKLIEIILTMNNLLWTIPTALIAQAEQHKPKKTAKAALQRSNTHCQGGRGRKDFF